MSSDSIDVDDWLADVQRQFPDTPDRLTREFEIQELKKLSDWKTRLEALRDRYKEEGDEAVPLWLQDVPGGSLTKPVLWSATTMTGEERDAWHRLFSCVAGQLADHALDYWQDHHNSSESAISLADVLNYLPIVFLYVLGSYDASREHSDHEGGFAESEDRVRLTTWVGIEASQHIRTYVRTIAYVVDRGSQTLHRVRTAVRRAQREIYDRKERKARQDEIVDYVADQTGYGSRVSRGTVEDRVSDVIDRQQVVSTEKPVGGSDNPEPDRDARTLGDQISSRAVGRDYHVDIYEYLRGRIGNARKREACLKLLDTKEKLTPDERFWF